MRDFRNCVCASAAPTNASSSAWTPNSASRRKSMPSTYAARAAEEIDAPKRNRRSPAGSAREMRGQGGAGKLGLAQHGRGSWPSVRHPPARCDTPGGACRAETRRIVDGGLCDATYFPQNICVQVAQGSGRMTATLVTSCAAPKRRSGREAGAISVTRGLNMHLRLPLTLGIFSWPMTGTSEVENRRSKQRFAMIWCDAV